VSVVVREQVKESRRRQREVDEDKVFLKTCQRHTAKEKKEESEKADTDRGKMVVVMVSKSKFG